MLNQALLHAEKGPPPRASNKRNRRRLHVGFSFFVGKATSAVSRNVQHELSQPELATLLSHIGLTKIKYNDFTTQFSFTAYLVCGVYIYPVYFAPLFVAACKSQRYARKLNFKI